MNLTLTLNVSFSLQRQAAQGTKPPSRQRRLLRPPLPRVAILARKGRRAAAPWQLHSSSNVTSHFERSPFKMRGFERVPPQQVFAAR